MERRGLLVGLFMLLSATMAWGSNLTEVRLGVHKGYTRVVFQLDGAASYRLLELRPADDGTRILILAIDATAPKMEPVQGGKSRQLEGLQLSTAQTGMTDVRIRLRGDMELKEFVLRKPDRIVLDFYDPGAGVAPLASDLAPPAPAEPAPLEPTARGLAEAAPEEPAPSGTALPEASPEPDQALGVVEEAPEAAPEPAGDTFAGVEIAELEPEQPTRSVVPTPSAAPLPEDESADGLLRSPVVLAALAGLALVVVLFVLGRRRGGRDEESLSPLDTAGDSDAPEGELFAEQEGASLGSSPEAEVLADHEPSEPAPFVDPPQDHDIEPEAAVAPPAAPALEEAEMNQGFDLPSTPEAGPAMLAPSTELGSGELGKLVEEFERRISHLENRLEEVVDAKERLERQVAAQTEELRVQRAAIARTQRVLRTIARPEEDASEPAPKP